MSRRRRALAIGVVVAMIGTGATTVAMAGPAAATANAAIVVTTATDVIDSGDGVISLREAVILANAQAGDDTIQLADGATYGLTICGADQSEVDPNVGDLNATGPDALTITGSAAFTTPPTIDQTCSQRVVTSASGPLRLLDAVVTGGAGGAIRANGPLTLDHVDQSGATDGDGGSVYGAVFAGSPPVSITASAIHGNALTGVVLGGAGTPANTVISGSSIRSNAAPTSAVAGGLYSANPMLLDHSEVSDNSGGSRVAGVWSSHSQIADSTIARNSGSKTGGIAGRFSLVDSALVDNRGTLGGGGTGTFTVTRSTVSGNHSTLLGGGLYGSGTVSDSTVSGNDTDGAGGGIVAEPTEIPAIVPTLVVTNSTITANQGAGSGGILAIDGWIDRSALSPIDRGDVTITTSTVSGNIERTDTALPHAPIVYDDPASDLAFARGTGEATTLPVGALTVTSSVLGDGGSAGPACALGSASPVTSGGYNFSADTSCVGGGPGDLVNGGDPGLSSLGNHGGPTATMPPTVGSPLIDHVPAAFSTCASSTDQRGVARPIGAGCEIGAVEVNGQLFHPVSPTRILDTRPEPQRVGPLGPWAAGATHDLTVVGGVSGVPSTATAVVLNVTATGGTANGDYLSIWPAGAPQPTVSSLNVDAGKTVANQVTVMLGRGSDVGKVSIFNAGGTQQVIVDVNGYYDPTAPDGFTALNPRRIIDSRPPFDRTGPLGPWSAGQTQVIDVTGSVAPLLDGADAVVLNVTATGGTANGNYLSVWPTGETQPTVSSINVDAGKTVPNAVTVKLGAGGADTGKISIFSAGGTQNVIVDVVGYFKAGAGKAFTPLSPRRAIDSRPPPLHVGPATVWGATQTQWIDVTAPPAGLPAGVDSVVANVTATGGTANNDYLTIWPSDQQQPTASSLNVDFNQTVANAVTVGVAPAGLYPNKFSVFNRVGLVNVIIDISGYYA